VQRHAIFTVTKKFPLGTAAAICTLHFDSFMTASYTQQLGLAGARFTGCQQRHAAMRPVVISVWNKTGAGFQN